MRYDFHCHTHYSDGILSPEQLVARAEELKIDLLAISDHDSISGIEQAKAYMNANNLNLNLVNAIELSAQSDFGEIHCPSFTPTSISADARFPYQFFRYFNSFTNPGWGN